MVNFKNKAKEKKESNLSVEIGKVDVESNINVKSDNKIKNIENKKTLVQVIPFLVNRTTVI